MPGDGKRLPVIVEAFRRAMVDVLVPEMKLMQGELEQLRLGQERILVRLERMELHERVTRLETLVEQLRKT